ncbi:hypothetical protein BC936DRAFT_144950 [Jimgerdemannia flammicorona]|uniref:Uncharacterized protein n=1 Tax=Jimgerdemannia flammicorona TaxID=994334 RepID=A0A433DBA0_9FUNG|nr:hypothetical protein BC936DRAFT_144950 [Jimgerdemannia flammicorona]
MDLKQVFVTEYWRRVLEIEPASIPAVLVDIYRILDAILNFTHPLTAIVGTTQHRGSGQAPRIGPRTTPNDMPPGSKISKPAMQRDTWNRRGRIKLWRDARIEVLETEKATIVPQFTPPDVAANG